jgi:hypothetical protein
MTGGAPGTEPATRRQPAPALPAAPLVPSQPAHTLLRPEPDPSQARGIARSTPAGAAAPSRPRARQGWLGAALWLALPALYLPEWFKVLSLAGSDFRSGGNGSALVFALLVPVLAKAARGWIDASRARALSGIAGLAGVVLYTSVHRSAWAEGAAWQAWLLALLGAALCAWRVGLPRPAGSSLAFGAAPLIGAHLASLWFPHAPVLCLALLLLIAADGPPATLRPDRRGWRWQLLPAALWSWLLAAPLFELGWGGSSWAWALAAGVAGLAAGAAAVPLALGRLAALALPLAGLLAVGLARGMPHGALGAALAALAGLGLGAAWRSGAGAPSGVGVAVGLALAYLQSQRELYGLPLLVLCALVLLTPARAAAPVAGSRPR